ncbi:MAG: hypothetical protein [Bacteriophage sp.]|nr:MAG: hypothetical protein [Bacteriophage sp.]
MKNVYSCLKSMAQLVGGIVVICAVIGLGVALVSKGADAVVAKESRDDYYRGAMCYSAALNRTKIYADGDVTILYANGEKDKIFEPLTMHDWIDAQERGIWENGKWLPADSDFTCTVLKDNIK